MRIYRQKRKEQSFDEALKRYTVTPYPSAERTVTTNDGNSERRIRDYE